MKATEIKRLIKASEKIGLNVYVNFERLFPARRSLGYSDYGVRIISARTRRGVCEVNLLQSGKWVPAVECDIYAQ